MAEEKSVSDDTATAASQPAAPRTSSEPARNETFVPLIFGGAVACVLGFFGGQIDSIETRLGLGGDDALTEVVEAQADALDRQAAEIAALTERLTAAEAIEPPVVDLSGVTTAISAQADALADLSDRIQTLEKQPMTEGLSEEAVAAYEAELEQLQASVSEQRSNLEALVEQQRSEIEALIETARLSETSAEEQARIALARAAMSRIITAVAGGMPYADALSELQASGDTNIPQVLLDHAEAGVPTMAQLRDAFPDNARAALAAARSGSTSGSVTGFLQRQLGVRSVEPREGDDPDAVLSRVEASLRAGQLGDALGELDGLPEPAQQAMADWIAQAKTRHAASAAADDLMSALATN